MKVMGIDRRFRYMRYCILDTDEMLVIEEELDDADLSEMVAHLEEICKPYPNMNLWVDKMATGAGMWQALVNSEAFKKRVMSVNFSRLGSELYNDLYNSFLMFAATTDMPVPPKEDPEFRYRHMITAFYGYLRTMKIGIDVPNDNLNLSKA